LSSIPLTASCALEHINSRLASKVVRVPANRQAYNRLLSKKLWELSAEYAGIQNLELLQEADIQPKRQVAPSPQVSWHFQTGCVPAH